MHDRSYYSSLMCDSSRKLYTQVFNIIFWIRLGKTILISFPK